MNFLQKVKFECVSHSPELLLGVGIAGAIVTVVAACKATLKVNEVMEEHKEDLEKIDYAVEHPEEIKEGKEYTEEDAKQDKIIRYKETVVEVVKAFAPVVILGTLSIGCMLKSNDILNKRNLSLAAAYTLLDQTFKEYRERAAKRFGEDVEKDLYYNLGEIEYTETDENGEFKPTTKEKIIIDSGQGYAKYFTRSNPDWDDNEDFITMFLRAQQTTANNMLRKKGWLTLNDVYKLLNFKETKAGMMVGWKYEPNNKIGDNFIQFDVVKTKMMNEDGILETVYLIDFNVDGDIYNRL